MSIFVLCFIQTVLDLHEYNVLSLLNYWRPVFGQLLEGRRQLKVCIYWSHRDTRSCTLNVQCNHRIQILTIHIKPASNLHKLFNRYDCWFANIYQGPHLRSFIEIIVFSEKQAPIFKFSPDSFNWHNLYIKCFFLISFNSISQSL